MSNKVKTTQYGGPDKQILIAEDSYKATLSAVATNTGISADSNGKKILRAGTPVSGDLTARNTAFVKATTTSGVSNANAIILHDVDVTAGAENATIVVAGIVDLNKIDTTTQELITTEAKAALSHIIFFK